MTRLRVHLFGELLVTDAQGHPLDLGSPTTRSLFAYLVYHRQPVDRRRLAFVFWPRGTEAAARRNLRQYLHRLRRALEPILPDAIQANSTHIWLHPALDLWVDLETFRHLTRPEASLEDLQSAVRLYRGDLLLDVYENWVEEPRAAWREAYLQALARLARGLVAAGRFNEALPIAQRWANEEPLDEAAHRMVMQILVALGDRARALQQYRLLCDLLAEELGVPPTPETQALAEQLAAEAPEPLAAPQPLPSLQRPAPVPVDIPLVGRDAELARLEEVLEAARQGRGRWLLITGEAGIGKTRLVAEHLARQGPLPVLQAGCSELEAMTPLAPLRTLIAQALQLFPPAHLDPPPLWLGTLLAAAPELAPTFGLPPSDQPPPPERLGEALHRMLLTLSHALAPNGPLHLVLDDLHWGDSSTWDLLAHLAQRLQQAPLVVLGLLREEDLPSTRHRLLALLTRHGLIERLPLRRLTEQETTTLARALLDQEPAEPHFFERLYQETEGNPFFIIEVVQTYREDPRRWSRREGPWLPRTIQEVIAARLERLPTESREWLGAAAVLGHSFTLPMLAAVTEAPTADLVQAIETWVQRGLVREEAHGYTFTHDKIRQVAYQALSRARRQWLHRQAAEALASAVPPADAATLAYHYARSDQPLKALPYLTWAGEQALRVRSYHEARQFGQQAIQLLGTLPGPRERAERVDLNLQLAQAYAFSGDPARALEILAETENLASALGDERRLGQVFYRSAQMFWLRGEPRVAGDYARRTLRMAEETGDPELLQAALRMLGRVSIATGAFDDAIAYLLRYLRLDHTPPPPQRPIVLGYLGVAYARVGAFARALEVAREGVALAEAQKAPEQIAFARMQLGFVHADAREWEACLEAIAPIPDPLADNAPLTPSGFMLLGLQGRALAHTGRAAEGIARIEPALLWAEQTDYRVFHYLPRLFYAEALLAAEQPERAVQAAQQALAQASQAGNRWAAAVARRVLAAALSRLPQPPWREIEAHLIESMHSLRRLRARPDLARTYLALRRLYDRAGQIAWAVDCHFRATTIFEELGMRRELLEAQGQAAPEARPSGGVLAAMDLRGPNTPWPQENDSLSPHDTATSKH